MLLSYVSFRHPDWTWFHRCKFSRFLIHKLSFMCSYALQFLCSRSFPVDIIYSGPSFPCMAWGMEVILWNISGLPLPSSCKVHGCIPFLHPVLRTFGFSSSISYFARCGLLPSGLRHSSPSSQKRRFFTLRFCVFVLLIWAGVLDPRTWKKGGIQEASLSSWGLVHIH